MAIDNASLLGSTDVVTDLVFLRREQKHEHEKPYKLQYNPGEGLPRTNCVNEETPGIVIRDIRGREHDFTLEAEGFAIGHLETKMSREDFFDDAKVKSIYYEELQEMALRTLPGAKRVEVLEHGIRKRHPEFPISHGGEYDHLQPTSVVHVDFTPNAVIRDSKEVLGIDPDKYSRLQSMNVWKPLHGPVTDWPLAVCDARTVNVAKDLIDTDVVTRTGFTENCQVYPSEAYKWYYLNRQRADEVVLFRQTDTDERYAVGVPHAGFRNPKSNASERPRESVEARVFVYY